MSLHLAFVGCAPVASQLGGAAVEGAVESAAAPSTRASIEDILSSPEVDRSVEQLGAAFTRGALTGAVQGPVELAPTVETIGASVVRGVASELPSTRELTDGALRSATSDNNRARVQRLVGDVTDTVVRTATASFAAGVEHDIVPMLAAARERAPTLASVLDDEAQSTIGNMVYEISLQTTLGIQRGLEQIGRENRAEEEGVLGRIPLIGWAVLISTLVLLFGAIAFVVALTLRNRKIREQLREESHEREQLLVTLVAGLVGREGVENQLHAGLLQFLGKSERKSEEPPPKPEVTDAAPAA